MDDHLFPIDPVKRCTRCGVIKPLDAFHRKTAARDGRQSRCRECNIETAKAHHADHLEHSRSRISEWARRVNDRNKRRVLAYLRAHPCTDCGETDPVVLEFDHRGDKTHGIAELLHWHVRWEVIAAEIAKCEVRCANCHRRRTAQRSGWFRHREQ